nr:hypothetical protein [Tanacetum cinerariifolium]
MPRSRTAYRLPLPVTPEGRGDTVQLKTVISTISQEYLLEFTSEYGISEDLYPKLSGPEERIVDFLEGKLSVIGAAKVSHFKINYHVLNINNRFFWVDERVFPTVLDWRTSAPKDEIPAKDTYSAEAVTILNTHHMDLFDLIRAPNPTKVKIGTQPRAAYKVSLLIVTASRVIEMEDPATSTESFGVPSPIERSPLDFANENRSQQSTGGNGTEYQGQGTIAPESTIGGKSLAAMEIGMGSTCPVLTSQDAPVNKSVAQVARRDQRIQARENEIKNLEALVEAETDMKKTAESKNTELGKKLENLRALFSDLQVSNDRLSHQVSTLQAQVTGKEKLKSAFEEFKQYENDRVEKRCAKMDARLDALSIDFDEELYPHMLSAIAGRRWVIGHGLRLAVMKCSESTELRQVFADVVSAWIAKGMSEGLKYGVGHGKANLDLEAIEAYDPEADAKYVTALHALRDLKYPMVDQLESVGARS